MKRFRAFILAEIVMTMLLQAGFILVLCTSFYLLTSFYGRTQQVLAARNHAERVISFMDDKIRHAGLGLWGCSDYIDIRGKLECIPLMTFTNHRYYRLPISLKWQKDDAITDDMSDRPLETRNQNSGDVLTVLYAQRDLSSGADNETITAFAERTQLLPLTYSSGAYKYNESNITLLDTISKNRELLTNKSLFNFGSSTYGEGNIRKYALMESVGLPLYLTQSKSGSSTILPSYLTLRAYGVPDNQRDNFYIPAGGELLGLGCMQMFVHKRVAGEGGQFAFRELKDSGSGWDNTYNQEKGILDIHMTLDTASNIFTLYVLATGGYDIDIKNPQPESWPSTWNEEYSQHIVYVSRKSWKLNNIPANFKWQ